MNLKKTYYDDISDLKREKIVRIIKTAKTEFYEKGIINSKISIIAKNANVGEASLYRYFTDKMQLVKLVAFDYWKEQVELFDIFAEKNIDPNSTGLAKVQSYLEIFLDLYYHHKPFLKFMNDLDTVIPSSNPMEGEHEFFEYIIYINKAYVDLFLDGIEDGSINPIFDGKKMYGFVSKIMVPTTQRIALSLGYSQPMDDESAAEFLNSTIAMFIKYIAC